MNILIVTTTSFKRVTVNCDGFHRSIVILILLFVYIICFSNVETPHSCGQPVVSKQSMLLSIFHSIYDTRVRCFYTVRSFVRAKFH